MTRVGVTMHKQEETRGSAHLLDVDDVEQLDDLVLLRSGAGALETQMTEEREREP